ncbi:hypothetical protein [Clostridium chauvoei]|nr:hypothetical protein [Clostridium chauvoei]
MLCGLQPQVKNTIARAGIYEKIGKEMIFWSADQAIVAADQFKTA